MTRKLLAKLSMTCGCALALATGCRTPGPTGDIPIGTWEGEGVYVYGGWDSDEAKAQGQLSTLMRAGYPTTLTIEPGTLDGREIVVLEIDSRRGALPGLGERTHARVALLEVNRFSEATVFYRLVDLLINEPADKPFEFDDDAPPASAICTVDNGDTLLQIQYGDNFTDTFRFYDNEVKKAGMFFGADGGIIQWWEELEHPRR